MINGIIFDLDGTLYDAESAYTYALNAIGIDSQSLSYLKAKQFAKDRLSSGHTSARNRVLYFKALLEQNGKFSPTQTLAYIRDYETSLAENLKIQWHTLNRAFLFEWIRHKNIQTIILTNENTRTQLVKLASFDPDERWFPHVLTSEELGIEKPNLTLFKAALEILSLQPQECLSVGDDITNDLWPAHQLGITPIWTREFIIGNPSIATPLPPNCQVIERLDELKNRLQSL